MPYRCAAPQSPVCVEMMSEPRQRFVRPRRVRIPAAAALAIAAAALSGCGSTIASLPGIGEPAEAQKLRSAVTPETPNVYLPAAERDNRAMNAAERAKLQSDLVTARDRAATDKREQINRPDVR